ncbi:endonuclease/exonuclease/phosphatase family protein [Prevotella sp. lc2012]|uniref:endonuclease/exonuclease/phosphatase family protein n=1 Tax=Prevotella sp. lc2012 TaxID=1761886 RepID=UPI000899EC6D|nr:endonuclease/exonuclease/phosphatase family protein [Prevotella sp. lc2012]SED97657.1 Endonuclease/Exonuclease/phosphatase family protein [Prevotella sp. lc2012]
MGKLAVQKYFALMMLIITFLLMIMTFTGLYGGHVHPGGNTARAMLVYALPILIIGNAIFLIYWLILRRFHWAIMPLVTLLCCIPYIGTLYQFRSFDEKTDAKPGIKVATYNVAMFGRETSGFMAQDILSEMKKQKVDVVCFQEYLDQSGDKKNSDSYKDYFPYMAVGESDMVIYSRYPIKQSKNLPFEMTNNSAMWAEVEVNDHVYRIYNVHLETTGINGTLHRAAKIARNGFDVQNNTLISAIYGNYTVGMIARSGQADVVAMDMRESKVPIIVCGDFNDVPYSYVYNTLLGDKIDGFKECGDGFMFTYRGNKKVRIDYVFHDQQLEGISYYKRELSYSDHYPVFMKMSPK